MAKITTSALPQSLNPGLVQILPADTTTLKTLLTAAAEGTIVQAISLYSTDSAARVVTFYITRSAVDYPLCAVSVPALAGSDGAVSAIDVLRATLFPGMAYDMAGNKILRLKTGDVLKCASGTTVTAAKAITVYADGEDF